MKKKPLGIICFPGTQCDKDMENILKECSVSFKRICHNERFCIKDYSGFILPGGFSYGDYLRSGALAVHSAVMQDLHKAVQKGFPVLGVCNGFQILCSSRLLEGALQINIHTRFIDEWVELKLSNPCSVWGGGRGGKQKKIIKLPVAHAEGRFYAGKKQIKYLEEEGLIWWKYETNINGSVKNIAGIMNKQKNVAGLMPHPERAFAGWMGGSDGLIFFQNFL